MTVVELGPNLLRRFYRGGPRIAEFRGLARAADDTPEDWIGSTTTAWGEDELGLSRLPDGRVLRDVVHVNLLVKLLDAGERLAVHLHPDDAFARTHLGAPLGKTEGWIILDADPGAFVAGGFARHVEAAELSDWVARQDVEAMLAAMQRVDVRAGDTVFVPAGVPHAIGAGILLLELQQPSDLSILLEGPDFLGLEPAVALTAVTRTPPDLARLRSGRVETLFPPEADAYFRAERVSDGATIEGPAIVVAYDGTGAVDGIRVRRGSTLLVLGGEATLSGACRAIVCRPPPA